MKKDYLYVVPVRGYLLNLTMPAESVMNSIEKKLYQLIIARLDGGEIEVQAGRERILKLARMGICGFIIFGGENDMVRPFVEELQSISETTLFIASDIERGVGQQIRGNTVFPCQMSFSAAVDRMKRDEIVILRDGVRAIAAEAKAVGINMPLVPVLDVNRDPDNPIICTRAFSDNPETVAWFGAEYIDILENSGLISCAKHFPGHGDTSADSHISLPVINKPLRKLREEDIMPFTTAIKRGVSSIMVGHLCVPALDDRPASLSNRIITGLLREELGFSGLILTDALNMDALKQTGSVPAECLNAGADILLHPSDPEMTMKELIKALESGAVSEARVDAAVTRILRVKARLARDGQGAIDYQSNERLSSRITEMSISLVKNTEGLLPVQDLSEVCLIYAGDSEMYGSSPLKKHFKKVFSVDDRKLDMVSHAAVSPAGEARPLEHPYYSKGDEAGCLGKIAVFAIFTSVSAWRGSSGISEEEKTKIHELMKKAEHCVVISFGSPYVLRHFKEADILIAAYESSEQAQKAVLKCLEGSQDFAGRLPVRINL
jgi:beta-glucosidase-like glycosyl hydrolase